MRAPFIDVLSRINEESKGELFDIPVEDYANKIFSKARLQLHIEKEEIVAFVAYYANDYESGKAFVTLIGVTAPYRGKGIAKALLELSIALLKKEGFKTYSLEVGRENFQALNLYKNLGFIIEEERGHKYLMTLLL